MKNLLLLMFVMICGITVSAQTQAPCSKSKKSCAKKCSKASAGISAVDTETMTLADALAKTDGNIEKRVNSKTGEATYFKKYTCEKSGNTKISQVEYCSKSNSFKAVEANSKSLEPKALPAKEAAMGQAKGLVTEPSMAKNPKEAMAQSAEENNVKPACSKDKGATKKACCKSGNSKKQCAKAGSASTETKACCKDKKSAATAQLAAGPEKKACCKKGTSKEECEKIKKDAKSN